MVFDDEDQLADLAAAKRGNREALERLLNRHTDRLFSVCMRMAPSRDEAEDLLQESLVRIIGALSQFRGEAKISTWMLRVTVNTCLTVHRKRRTRQARVMALPDPEIARTNEKGAEPGALDAVEQRELMSRVKRVFAALPSHQRAILVLRDFQQLDYQEIATVLEVPVGTVKSRLFRARLALREGVEGG